MSDILSPQISKTLASDFRMAGILIAGKIDPLKTTIDIPDQAMSDAMRFTGASGIEREGHLDAMRNRKP